MNLYIGIVLVFVGQVLGWFQLNAQYLSKWWGDKPWTAAFLLGVPTSVAFWYAWKLVVDHTGSAWTARFIGSSAGLIVFPILTWWLLGESMFTPKTMICLGLAVIIMLVQLFW
tara:strand:- start:580 stop:918 length:339 start_codon:yes stop_codon:yes gene_type:complete